MIVCLFIVCDDADRLEQPAKDRKIFVIGIDGGVGSAVKSVGNRDRRKAERNPQKRRDVLFFAAHARF